MILARSETDELLEPTRDVPGFCPLCRARLIPRMGDIRYHHWAHEKGAECDSWAEESPWHIGWKKEVDKKYQEVPIKKGNQMHFADIRLPTGVVVEFQKRSLDPAVWEEREAFYGRMIWVIYFPKDRLLDWDIREKYLPTFRDSLIEVKGFSDRFIYPRHRFPMFLDFTDGDMFWIKEFQESYGRETRMFGRFLTKAEFIDEYLHNPFFFDVEHLNLSTYHADFKRKQYELWDAKRELESLKQEIQDILDLKKSIERGNRARKKYDEYCRYSRQLFIAKNQVEQQPSCGVTNQNRVDEIARLDKEFEKYPLREADDDLFWCE